MKIRAMKKSWKVGNKSTASKYKKQFDVLNNELLFLINKNRYSLI
ncbi:hypothetical protein [Marinomonas balearica]|uniref:Uncharacterized protein n=1 Tax=Marinomonas balearica TaxID=491947 RepID=A0A4R6MCJ5_9GAMM|nr:hypothetical protein [Marinomonas balearica]TDO98885.1 hypothetical protein DFP79_1300 [Marinomonas balearica]